MFGRAFRRVVRGSRWLVGELRGHFPRYDTRWPASSSTDRGLAAGAALVPPLVLLAATHSVAVLVRTRAGGATYWCALLMTVALACCAFVLSFDALRSLAITLGLPATIA
jgi:hypothetical protein